MQVAYKIKVTTNVASNKLPSVWGALGIPFQKINKYGVL